MHCEQQVAEGDTGMKAGGQEATATVQARDDWGHPSHSGWGDGWLACSLWGCRQSCVPAKRSSGLTRDGGRGGPGANNLVFACKTRLGGSGNSKYFPLGWLVLSASFIISREASVSETHKGVCCCASRSMWGCIPIVRRVVSHFLLEVWAFSQAGGQTQPLWWFLSGLSFYT